jgi:hypothetical protein
MKMRFINSPKLTSGWRLTSMLGLAMLVLPAGRSAEPITIRVVDGRNGDPISDEKLQLWFNSRSGSAMSISTDKQGVAKVDAPSGAALLLSANLYVDCRYSKQTGPERPTYPVSVILRSGVLAANTCGKLKLSPTPGELIFFVRPEHWWEGMKR